MPGFFDDNSMLRVVHRERAIALSGPRALLMQAAHPLAVSGLLAHSTAMDEPYDRLARTAEVMSTIGFGERRGGRAHHRARARDAREGERPPAASPPGASPTGTPYRADQPDLLLWVLFTLVDSGVVVYRKYVRSMSRAEEEAYWEDYKVVGDLFGLADADMPDTLDDLHDYRREMLEGDTLLVTDWARRRAQRDRDGAAGALGRPAAAARRPTSSPSRCCPTASGASTASSRSRRPPCARRWWPAAPSTSSGR